MSDLKQVAAVVRNGPGNETDRLALLDAHRARVDAPIQALEQARDIIAWKTDLYEGKLRTGDTVGLWGPTTTREAQADHQRRRQQSIDP